MKNWLGYSFFVLLLFLALYGLTYTVKGKGWALGERTLQYPSHQKFKEMFALDTTSILDVKEILQDIDTTLTESNDTLENVATKLDSTAIIPKDSLKKPSKIGKININKKKLEKVSLPKSENPFKSLYNQLTSQSSIRIAHYGDSQIECDRITSYIRQKLQSQFGGNGPGFIPSKNIFKTSAFKQTTSKNIKRYTLYGRRDKRINHRNFGYMASMARFTAPYTDSIINDSLPTKKAWITLKPSSNALKNTRKYNTVDLYLGNILTPLSITIKNSEGSLIQSKTLQPSQDTQKISLNFNHTPSSLTYYFESAISPDIYGFDLHSNQGVYMDNIAMRGASGYFPGLSNKGALSHFYKLLDVDFFLLEFGGNAMPAIRDSIGARRYAKQFYYQIKNIQKMRPNAGILVIGPADMSLNQMGDFKTYPLLPYTIKKLKEESLAAGAAYWDMYQAMGGYNSMPTWVSNGLAVSDHIHFSYSGAKFISQMLYESILFELSKFELTP